MKKSFLSVSMLVISLSLLTMYVCSTAIEVNALINNQSCEVSTTTTMTKKMPSALTIKVFSFLLK